MTDDLLRQISEALDSPDGLEGDVALQRRLARDEAASDLAEEVAAIDRTLRRWPLPNRSRAAWASLAARIDARLDDEPPAMPGDATAPPAFDDHPPQPDAPNPATPSQAAPSQGPATIPSPPPAESESWPPPPPPPVATSLMAATEPQRSDPAFRDEIESLPSDLLESEPPPAARSLPPPVHTLPPPSSSLPPSLPPGLSRPPSSLPPRTGDRFSLPSVPPVPMSSTTHLDAAASLRAQSHRPRSPGRAATWVASGVAAGAVAAIAFFFVRASLVEAPRHAALAPAQGEASWTESEAVRGGRTTDRPAAMPSGQALAGDDDGARPAPVEEQAAEPAPVREAPSPAAGAAPGVGLLEGAEARSRRSASARPSRTEGSSDDLMDESDLGRGGGPRDQASDAEPASAPPAPSSAVAQGAEGEPADRPEEDARPPSDPASLSDTPSREDVLAALQPLTSAVASCGGGARSGVARVAIRFAGSGRVQSALVGDDFSGTPEGSCIARTVRRARIRPFRQASFEVTYPFRIP